MLVQLVGEPDAILQHATTKSLNLIFWCPSLTSVLTISLRVGDKLYFILLMVNYKF